MPKGSSPCGLRSGMVGGLFEDHLKSFLLPNSKTEPPSDRQGHWFLSGRGALRQILKECQSAGFHHVQLPAFLCKSILQSVHISGMSYSFYPVGKDLTPKLGSRRNAAVLLVHFFGHSSDALDHGFEIRKQGGHVIHDFSHCPSFSIPAHSPDQASFLLNFRKWSGLPGGAWATTTQSGVAVNTDVMQVINGCHTASLRKREYLSEGGPRDLAAEAAWVEPVRRFEDFLNADASSYALPDDQVTMMERIDWQKIRLKREANLKTLDNSLPNSVQRVFNTKDRRSSPFGLPILVAKSKRDRVRSALADMGIFLPIHWQLPHEVASGTFADSQWLSERILTLPIDQRYTQHRMEKLAIQLLNYLR